MFALEELFSRLLRFVGALTITGSLGLFWLFRCRRFQTILFALLLLVSTGEEECVESKLKEGRLVLSLRFSDFTRKQAAPADDWFRLKLFPPRSDNCPEFK